MSRLVMWNVITLDGFFEGTEDWDLEFHESVWGDELESVSIAQLKGADRLLFGRVTYEGMASYWQAAEGEVAGFMNALPKVVCSRPLERADWENSTLVAGDCTTAVRELKGRGDGETLVFGSADLSATLMQDGLFDEYRLVVAPVMLGAGRALFGRGLDAKKLTLLEARPLSSGGVILRYAPADV
jgi:dihydrofolate reductase